MELYNFKKCQILFYSLVIKVKTSQHGIFLNVGALNSNKFEPVNFKKNSQSMWTNE